MKGGDNDGEQRKKKKEVNLSLKPKYKIKQKTYDDFAKCCECNSISISEQIRFFIMSYINDNKEFLIERGEKQHGKK